jgi:hypothetical protein
MFSYIGPDILEMDSVRKTMAQEIAKKTPMKTVPGRGDAIYSLFAFTLDPVRPNGYRVTCDNLRDSDEKNSINTDELPSGFYCVVQSKAGNFFALRTAIGASSHPKALQNVGLDSAQSNVLSAGELFVGPSGKMLFFNTSSGGYHPATTQHYILDKKAEHAQQLTKIGLPVALIVGEHRVCGMEEMYKKEKDFFENNGRWDFRRTKNTDYKDADNELNQLMTQNLKEIHFSPAIIQTLDGSSKAFLVNIVKAAKELKSVLDKQDAKAPMLSTLFVPVAPVNSADAVKLKNDLAVDPKGIKGSK